MKYSCNNCGHVWEGDDFTVDCPNCESDDIGIYTDKDDKVEKKEDKTVNIPTSSAKKSEDKTVNIPHASKPKEDKTINVPPPSSDAGKTQFISPEDYKKEKDSPTVNIPSPSQQPKSSSRSGGQESTRQGQKSAPPPPSPPPSGQKGEKKSGGLIYALIGLVVILAGAGIWYFTQGEGEENDDKKEVAQDPDSEAKVRIVEEGEAFFIRGSIIEGNSERTIKSEDILSVYRANDRREVKFDNSTGQVYFCEDMEGLTAFVLDIKGYEGPEAVTDGVELSLFGNPPAPEANCVHRLEAKFIEVAFPSACKMQVKITDPYDYGDEGLEVSITGRDGQYVKNKFSWDVKAQSGKTVDVWVKQNNMDPVAYAQNGSRVIPKCGNDVDWNAITAKLAAAAQQFGANPRDRSASRQLQELSMETLPGDPIFIVDGEQLKGFSSLSTKFRISNMNDGQTFELTSQPQIVSKRYWKIEFKSK